MRVLFLSFALICWASLAVHAQRIAVLALLVLGWEVEARSDLGKCVELRPELKTDLDRRVELARRLMVQSARVVSSN